MVYIPVLLSCIVLAFAVVVSVCVCFFIVFCNLWFEKVLPLFAPILFHRMNCANGLSMLPFLLTTCHRAVVRSSASPDIPGIVRYFTFSRYTTSSIKCNSPRARHTRIFQVLYVGLSNTWRKKYLASLYGLVMVGADIVNILSLCAAWHQISFLCLYGLLMVY